MKRMILLIAALVLVLVPAASNAAVCNGGLPDTDNDGCTDADDNCVTTSNPLQLDTDCDGIGNACDADFNNDGQVNTADFVAFVLGSTNTLFDIAPPFNGVSDLDDQAAILAFFQVAPGPGGPIHGPYCPNPMALTAPYYCVTGVGTGTNYDWRLSGGGVIPTSGFTEANVTAAPSGSSAKTLMLNFQSSIQETSTSHGISVEAVSIDPQACFKLSDPLVTLDVKNTSLPPTSFCTVGTAGCTFNPVIFQVLNAVPALSPGSLIGLSALLCGVSLVIARRRWKAQQTES